MRRRNFLLGAAAGVALRPSLAGAHEAARRSLVIVGGQSVPVLDPHLRYDWSTRMMQQCVYDALAKYVGDPPQIIPWLAETWESGGDGLTWTFTLSPDAKFHNGDPVDAEAVRFSYARALTLDAGVAWMLKDALAPEAIKAPDARTVVFTLKRPWKQFLSFVPWWFVVNPKEVTAHQAGDDRGRAWLADHAAGSGPFRIRRWDGATEMVLEAVPGYWKGWPQAEKDRPAGVTYRVLATPAARLAALERGEADIAAGLSPEDDARLAKNPHLAVGHDPGLAPLTIAMNTRHGPCADVSFRKALAYAFDGGAMAGLDATAHLMDSPFPAAIPGHVAVPEMPRHNLDLARQYLAKSPHAKGGVTLEYVHVAGLETERRVGLALADALQALGVTLTVTAASWPEIVARGAKPETTPDLVALYVTPVSTDPDAVASQYASAASGRYWGMHHLHDPDLDKLLAQAREEPDKARRLALYGDIQKLVVADQPAIFAMLADRRWAMRGTVRGFVACPVRMAGEFDLHAMYDARTT